MVRAAGRGDLGRVPGWIEPMLAKPDGGRLRTGPAWAYEYKLDGFRATMRIAADGTTMLTSRNGIDFTAEFTTLTAVLSQALDGSPALLDGEVVVYNEMGQIDFELLQQRRGRYQKHRGPEPFEDVAVRYLAFDLLQLGDRTLLNEPYDERRRLLSSIAMPDPFLVAVVPALTFDQLSADRLTPQQLLDRVAAEGHEGLVAKRRDSPYVPGRRTGYWCKHPLVQTSEVIVCGWRPGQRSFEGRLGGLLLGGHDPDTGELIYIGDVGTGFNDRDRADLRARLEKLERRRHPFATTPPREDVIRARWVDPVLVGEVQFRQFTRGAGRVRGTSWRGLRPDRNPSEVVVPRAGERSTPVAVPPTSIAEPEKPAARRVTVRVGDRRLVLSNLDKVLHPDGFTKGEVINYYSRIAPLLLPHLTGRPVTFIRFPDGVDGKAFFQKDVGDSAPEWLATAQLSDSGSRGLGEPVEYALINELAALVWAANLAALELHVPQWTVQSEARSLPDRLVFDLDRGPGATVVECCRVAERLHDLLTADGLSPVVKTSGSKGLQVYAGVVVSTAQEPSTYAKAVATRFAAETPELVTAKMTKAQRAGKVFIDWSQNNPAKTTIAPYSLCGRDEPTVSTPVAWDEVRVCRRADQLAFTAEGVLDRVDQLGDLFGSVAERRALPLPLG